MEVLKTSESSLNVSTFSCQFIQLEDKHAHAVINNVTAPGVESMVLLKHFTRIISDTIKAYNFELVLNQIEMGKCKSQG